MGLIYYSHQIIFLGEMAERLKAHDWKSCISRKGYRGFESLSLHQFFTATKYKIMAKLHRFKVDKLIRDKTATNLRAKGVIVFDRVMKNDEYLQRLKNKLLEESNEAISSKTKTELCHELADVFEVMMTLAKVNEIELKDIVASAAQHKEERGGFESKIYCSFVEVEENHPNFEYYKTRPDQYPEERDSKDNPESLSKSNL